MLVWGDRVIFRCSLCGEDLGEVDLDPRMPYVLKCPKCDEMLAVISVEKKIPLLPFEPKDIAPKFLKD